jgi:glycosyltransferase involved in cell wall biosynthesis
VLSAHPIRVLHVAPAFYPATYWGGPTVSVYEICNELARSANVTLRVLTTDTAGPRTVDRLTEQQKASSHYVGYEVTFCAKWFGRDFTPSLWWRIWPLASWADVIHLTAVYSATTFPTLLAARLLGKPVVWSPRGALQRWAGSRNLVLKRCFEFACRVLLSQASTVLHATSNEEAEENLLRIPARNSAVIPNGVHILEATPHPAWMPGGKLRLLFLGRLDPKKGVDNLLAALSRLRAEEASLTICGTGDRAYVLLLEARTRELGLTDRVRFAGQVDAEARMRSFQEADVCIVPSHTENFAMVVAEALGNGIPVIASTGTPWRDIESRGTGRWVANDPESLADAIRSMRSADLPEMGRRGRDWMRAEYSWRTVGSRMLDIYRRLVDRAVPSGVT